MTSKPLFDKVLWGKKAMAFVTRSHRHLWGKNNEDPQAFFFTRGLKNQFVKDMLMGWNKFGQERSIQNWGFQADFYADKKLFLPSGIVIPFIVEKELRSIFIHPYDENKNGRTTMVPGSMSPTMILGTKKEKVAVVHHLFDGLFLFQETKETCCVMIHPDPALPLNNHFKSIIKTAGTVFIFSSKKKEDRWNRQVFPDVPDHFFYAYQTKKELKECCLIH